METTEKEKLTIFRICLESNIINLTQIENWAENILMESKDIRDDYILDLCQAKSKGINEIVHILKQNEGEISNPIIWQIVYGITGISFENKKIDLKKACYFISKVANEMTFKTEYDLFGMGLDDSFYLASIGSYGNLDFTKKEFIKMTKEYEPLAKSFLKQTFGE
ncbi:hypothetical protein FLJC2902T_31700 [Flavobacterium limnosediminis JC2902]|uniref:Uncharacterized protein n=1 Tax=Flavobacterium limnosediminis JC2902 TaxID=1341181 RepID=V6SEX2_9FLAO|nr:hypothetical protein [Flavobacterium limnosediminis]ESU25228.1 hypothetical protein FLJC2902T_31700 [Flavobacterium limnosediminis JC2902]